MTTQTARNTNAQHESLLNNLTNKGGVIEVDQPEVDVEIDVRDEGTTLFESESGRLFMETSSHNSLFEVVPSFDGPVIEIASAVETTELTELPTADPAEQPDVNGATVIIEQRGD